MTYLPNSQGGLPSVTTTEAASGRQVDGVNTFLKLVKQSGNLSTGITNIAHGISTIDRVISAEAYCHRDNGAELPFPFVSTSSTFVNSFQLDGTNIIVNVGTGFTGAGNTLSDLHTLIEYTKT